MKKLSPIRTGTIAELKAIAWLWEQGYEVFYNICHNGATDMVVEREGRLTRIDVKAARRHRDGGYLYNKLTPEQIIKGIRVLYYIPDTGEFVWGENVKKRGRPRKKVLAQECEVRT